MASAHTTNAAARTTIAVMEEAMSWEELYKELMPDIPFEKAKTINQIIQDAEDQGVKLHSNHVRDTLENKVKNEGWTKLRWKNSMYYWPPDEQK